MVVTVDQLDCLDHLIWLRSGAAASERLGLAQPTVSRHVRSVERAFEISVTKTDGEWRVLGDQTILNLARHVHQEYRWLRNLPLRIEAQYYSGPLFCDPAPPGWQVGNFDFLEVHTPLDHLRTGVIDAWIGCYPDVPDADDSEFACFDLTRLPTHIVVAQGHPLTALGDSVTLEDVRQYHSLALRDNAFPKVQRILQSVGLWNLPLNLKRYSRNKWEGRVEDLIIGYATCFSMSLYEVPQVILPIAIPLEVGDTLIVRRQYAKNPRLLALLEDLKGKAFDLSQRFPDVRIPLAVQS